MSNFTKKKHLIEDNSEEIVNSIKQSEINGDNDMSSENISRSISVKTKKTIAQMMWRKKVIFSMANGRKQG